MRASDWLFGGVDRVRLLDMDRRIKPMRRNTLVLLAVTLLLCTPWLGWWPVGPVILAGAFFAIAGRRAPQAAHPEYEIFGAWVLSELIIATSVTLVGRSTLGMLCWLAIPIVGLPARFPVRVVALGVAIALGLTMAVGFATDAQTILHDPPLLAAPAALIIAIAMLSMALMRSDVEHRDDCVIDQLTGMLNRRALASRAEELAQQSAVSGQPIAVIEGDLDHFKAVNDRAGHAAGDAVLADVAYQMRKCLRAFDLAYRIGGEEFVVLMPGADLQEAMALAEKLRVAAAAATVGDGERVTMSFGVGASALGEQFRFRDVFAAADAALYEAKRTGRNRVAVAGLYDLASSPDALVCRRFDTARR